MKQFLLILLVTFISVFSFAGNSDTALFPNPTEPEIAIFPNPAVNYFEIKNASNVDQVVIYTMLGVQIKSFETVDQNFYDIVDLSHGLYLVQFLDADQSIIATRRLSKK